MNRMGLKSVIFGLIASIAFASTVVGQNRPAVMPSQIPTTSASEGRQCCVCVYPNPGEKDSEAFHDLCDSCLPVKYPNCEVRASFAAAALKDGLKSLQCRPPLYMMNLQHGPAPVEVKEIIEVCQSAYPGCTLHFNDLSCSTFENEESAQFFISVIRESLPDGAIVDLCGSGSVNKFAGCTFFRTTKRYVIAPAFSKEKLGLCPRFGDACDFSVDGQKSFRCVDTLGRTTSIQCCPLQDPKIGYWGDSHGCKGRGCNQTNCPNYQTCRDGTWRKQECSRDGACIKYSYKCGEVNKICGHGETGEECVSRFPTPSPTVDTD